MGQSGYANWFLGHALNSTTGYFTMTEEERRVMYKEKIMETLSFLDYTSLAQSDEDIKGRLEQKDTQMKKLTEEVTLLTKQMEIYRPLIESMTDTRQCPNCKKMSIRKDDPFCAFCGSGFPEPTDPEDYINPGLL